MKRIAILFACILALFALSACDENPQVIGILKDASELEWLEVTAYYDEFHLIGGAVVSPSFRNSVFNYTVHVAKDVNRFVISAGIDGEGTIEAISEKDLITGMEFDYLDDEPKVILMTVQRKHMDAAEYRLTVERMDMVPVAEDIEINVYPEIGAFFIDRGVFPIIEVKANLPYVNGVPSGELSYQWYMNTANNTRDGYPIGGATGSTYTMRIGETRTVRTVYYYVEITNTIGGQTGVTVSPPQAVTFLNKNGMDEKSLKMVSIPPGSVTEDTKGTRWGAYGYPGYEQTSSGQTTSWSTPGFSMGSCPVTWELWKTVFDRAEAGNYSFARIGNQGGAKGANSNTNLYSRPIGNKLHPVTFIGWREAVVWCNAYSEMDGLEPVYRGFDGEPLRDSRELVDLLIDADNMDWNGYRLPTAEEWFYAGMGANPGNSSPWTDRWPGTNDPDKRDKYSWTYTNQVAGNEGMRETGEVGSLLPLVLYNGSELYDILGMVRQWVWWASYQNQSSVYSLGDDFGYTGQYGDEGSFDGQLSSGCPPGDAYSYDEFFTGFRLARNGGN